MADNAQIEIRLKLEQEVKQRNREQYESIFAGISRIQRDRNLVDFYDEADEIMHELDVPSSAMDLPPDPKVIARYTSMVRRVQGKMATGAQLPGAPGSQQQSNISPLSPAQHAALSAQLGQAGINVNPFGNFNAPMRGGAPGPAGRGRGVGQTGLPADIQRFAQQYQAELAQIGDEVFDRLEKQVLSDQMREAAIDRIRRIRDDASRQALRFPLTSPSRSAVRDIERGASEMQRRLSGQSSQLGFAGAEQVRYDQDVRAPLQDLIRQGVGGGAINRDALADAMRDAEMRRGDIRSNPNIDPSLARRRTEAMAQDMRQASQLARLFPETVQRGTPGRDLAAVSPGAVAGFENLQRIRSELQGAREGPMGQLASNRQRELLAELNINQQINRTEQERLRSEGLMTRERQHRFNVLQNEYRLTERAVQDAPVRLTAGDISRNAAMMGPQAMIGQALQRIAFERGDVGQTGGLAAAGQLMQRGGFTGLAMGGLQYGGSRLALAGAGALGMPTSGGVGALIGGLGAMAPVLGVGAIAGGLAMALSQVNAVTNLGMDAASLWRRGGGAAGQGLGVGFGRGAPGTASTFLQDIMSTGAGLAFSRDQVMSTANILASTGGLASGQGDIAMRTRGALTTARFLGMGPDALAKGIGTLESVNMIGPGQGGMPMDRFADMLAQGIERGRMRGRENEVLSAIVDLTKEFALRGASIPNMPAQTAGLITAMNATGVAGLRGQFGQQMLSQVDQSITGARGVGEALLFQSYNRQAGGGLNYLDFMFEQGMGLGSQFSRGAWGDIGALGGQDPRRRAFVLNNQFFGGDRKMLSRVMELDKVFQSNPTPEAWEAAVQGTMEEASRPGARPSEGLQGIEGLREAENKLTNTVQDWATTLTPTIEKVTSSIADLSDSIRNLAEGLGGDQFAKTVADAVTTAAGPIAAAVAKAVADVLHLPSLPSSPPGVVPPGSSQPGIVPPGGQPPGRGQVRPSITPPNNPPIARIPLPGGGNIPIIPHPTIIQTPFGPITLPDVSIGNPEFGPRPPAGEAPGLPAPGPSEPSPSAIPSVGADQFMTQTQPTGDTCGPTAMATILTNAGMPTTANEARKAMGDFLGHDPIGPYGMSWDRVDKFVEWYAQQHGNQLRATGNPSPNEIIANMEAGQPTMFSTNQPMATALGMTRSNIAHIVVGVSAANGVYTVADPATGRLFRLDRNQMGQLAQDTPVLGPNDRSGRGLLFQNYSGPGAQGAPSLPSAGDEALPGVPSTGGTVGGTEAENRAAVARTAREIGLNPQLAFAGVLQEGGFVNPRQYEGYRQGNPSRTAIPGLTGRGMYQFSWTKYRGHYQGELGPYVQFLKEMGVIPENDTSYDLVGMPDNQDAEIANRVERLMSLEQAWTPEIQTRYFARYAARRGVDIGASYANPTELSRALTRIQGPADQSGNAYVDVARRILSGSESIPDTTPSIPYMDPNGSTLPLPGAPQSYTPMDPSAVGASSAMRISIQPATATLMWPNGELAGILPLNAFVDIPSNTDINSHRTLNYYGDT